MKRVWVQFLSRTLWRTPTQRRRKEVWDGGQNHRGSEGRESRSGVQGQNPGRGLRTKSPRRWIILKVATSKFYTFWVDISHIFTYICLCFSVLAGIIPLSLQNRGIWYRLPPRCLQVGATAPSAPPAPPPMLLPSDRFVKKSLGGRRQARGWRRRRH